MSAMFAALPPDINSARMYTGPGSGPILVAAAWWDALAAELQTTASACLTVLSDLTGTWWRGPTSQAMIAAVNPYIRWLTTSAARAEHTALQAKAAACAFEAAFAQTIPPPMIAANRSTLAGLLATNFFGQNLPAISATEMIYAEFWAADATAMAGYAAASAAASRLPGFTAPSTVSHPETPHEQPAPPDAIRALSNAAAGLNTIWANLPDATAIQEGSQLAVLGGYDMGYLTAAILSQISLFSTQVFPKVKQFLIPTLLLEGPLGPITAVSSITESATAAVGNAGRVSLVSVPPSWAGQPQAPQPGATPLDSIASGEPGSGPPHGFLPAGGSGDGRRSGDYSRRRYGVRPVVVPRMPGKF